MVDTVGILSDGDANKARTLRNFTRQMLVGYLRGVNMNSTLDQALLMTVPSGLPYRIVAVTMANASISLTTAAGGLYTAASKGGTAVVLAAQVYTALTGPTLALDLTIDTTPGITLFPAATQLYFALTTAQGAAATADLFVHGQLF